MIQNATESSSKYIIPKVYFQEAVVGSELILFMLRNLGPRTPLYNALKTGEEVSKTKEALLQKAESYFKISYFKNKLIYPDEAQSKAHLVIEKTYADIYKNYQKALFENNALDFDDLLILPLQLFNNNPKFL